MQASHIPQTHCRIGGRTPLVPIMDLGLQAMTGVFPQNASEAVASAPIELAWCEDSGLVQLAHSYDPRIMFGDNYGYRSGLNASMVRHLTGKVKDLEALVQPQSGDIIVDIGSNDGTTLGAYQSTGVRRIGIDPTAVKFKQYYALGIEIVPDFFSAATYRAHVPHQNAKIVSSIAMFYDLESPIDFARDIAAILDADGVWHLEQSYLPLMLSTGSYDTICHEHLEYYSLAVMQKILDAADLKLIKVTLNDINGGSFAVTAAKKACQKYAVDQAGIDKLMAAEQALGLNTLAPYRAFEARAKQHRTDLTALIRRLNQEGKRVLGYGASTKGNVTLQYCGLTSKDLLAVAEINPEKFGRVTPGTHIPIVSMEEAERMQPDYYLVLPWHFRDGILQREQAFRNAGGKFIFPFPTIDIV